MFGKKWIEAILIGLLCLSFGFAATAAEDESQTAEVTQVDINTADAETLAQVLEGVGIMKARDIVAYRETYGDFKTVDELVEVQGIGPVTLERNRERITLSSE
ncbi:MAG: ComEA family DNA-binding protein [Pseudohongiellaceae bacterium]